MKKDRFEVGENVFGFDLGKEEPVVTEGFIRGVEISNAGHIQYKFQTHIGILLGSTQSLGRTKEEALAKLENQKELMTKTKSLTDEFFGKPDFDLEGLTKDFPKPVQSPLPINKGD